MMRALRVARRSAVKARTQAANQLRALLFTAPEELRTELGGLSTSRLVSTAARFRPGTQPRELVAEAAPALVALKGVGGDTAAALLIAAGDNPERHRSEAAFARLCGVSSPIQASSGGIVSTVEATGKLTGRSMFWCSEG